MEFCVVYLDIYFRYHGSTRQRHPQKSKTQKKCSICNWFIKKSDPHALCALCRPCRQDKPCSLDQQWTEEDWTVFAVRRDYLSVKRAKSTANLKPGNRTKDKTRKPEKDDGLQKRTTRPGMRESFSLS